MTQKRKQYSAAFKFKVALDATRNLKTISQLASEYEVHPNQVSEWKRQLLNEGTQLFTRPTARAVREPASREAEVYEQLGRLQMELAWLKKKLPLSSEHRRALIDPHDPHVSVRRQCELLEVNRATYYYQPVRASSLNLELIRRLDEQYMRTPYYGWPRMTAHLRRLSYAVNPKRVRGLLQLMGLQAIYPKPRTSQRHAQHRIYPYLLRDLTISQPNQVWSTDITNLPMRGGFLYLVAVMDWFSR